MHDFKLGDVVLTKQGELFQVNENVFTDYDCTISDAIRWSENGNLKGIYPVEQFKAGSND